MQRTYRHGDSRVVYDLEAGTYTRFAPDGAEVAETREITDDERATLAAEDLPARVQSLTDALDMLILDMLGGF